MARTFRSIRCADSCAHELQLKVAAGHGLHHAAVGQLQRLGVVLGLLKHTLCLYQFHHAPALAAQQGLQRPCDLPGHLPVIFDPETEILAAVQQAGDPVGDPQIAKVQMLLFRRLCRTLQDLHHLAAAAVRQFDVEVDLIFHGALFRIALGLLCIPHQRLIPAFASGGIQPHRADHAQRGHQVGRGKHFFFRQCQIIPAQLIIVAAVLLLDIADQQLSDLLLVAAGLKHRQCPGDIPRPGVDVAGTVVQGVSPLPAVGVLQPPDHAVLKTGAHGVHAAADPEQVAGLPRLLQYLHHIFGSGQLLRLRDGKAAHDRHLDDQIPDAVIPPVVDGTVEIGPEVVHQFFQQLRRIPCAVGHLHRQNACPHRIAFGQRVEDLLEDLPGHLDAPCQIEFAQRLLGQGKILLRDDGQPTIHIHRAEPVRKRAPPSHQQPDVRGLDQPEDLCLHVRRMDQSQIVDDHDHPPRQLQFLQLLCRQFPRIQPCMLSAAQITAEQFRLAVSGGTVDVNILARLSCHTQFFPRRFRVDVYRVAFVLRMLCFRHLRPTSLLSTALSAAVLKKSPSFQRGESVRIFYCTPCEIETQRFLDRFSKSFTKNFFIPAGAVLRSGLSAAPRR